MCPAPKALKSVSRLCPTFIRVSPNAFIRVSPNAPIESATEFASLAYLCSLRSHVFQQAKENSCVNTDSCLNVDSCLNTDFFSKH